MARQDAGNNLVVELDQGRVVELPRPRYLNGCIESMVWLVSSGEELVVPRVSVGWVDREGEILYV